MGTGRKLLLVLCAAQFVDVLSGTAVLVALPDIRRDLGLSLAAAQGVVSAYALLFGALLLLAGRLADVYGRRPLLVLGLAVFGLAGLVGGAAQNGLVLVAARAVQGAAAAATVPPALAILTDLYRGAAGRRALAAWTAAGAGGGAAGFVVGGLVTGALDWRATLFLIAGLALLATVAAAIVVPREGSRHEKDGAFDVAGAALGTGGLLLVLVALTRVESGGVDVLAVAAAVAGALLLGSFLVVERRVSAPLLTPGTFRNRALAVGVLASAALTATTSPPAVLGTTYLQTIRGWSPTDTGLAFVPFSLAVVAGSWVGQRLLGTRGARTTMVSGLLVIGGAAALSATVGAGGGEARLVGALVLSGAGLGCAAVAATATGTGAVAAARRGLASGLVNTGTQLGTAIGVAVIVPLAGTTLRGLRGGWLATAAVALVAAGAVAVAARPTAVARTRD
jgi:MFS family permease